MLAAIDWNSTAWQAPSTPDDLANAEFGFVAENQLAYTALTFGHTEFPADDKGWYASFLPQLYTKTINAETIASLKVVFIKSRNYHDGKTYIVGLYAFPVFQKSKKSSPIESITHIIETNVKALPKDIHLLTNPVSLDDQALLSSFLPKDKKIGKKTVNYLTKLNVEKILDAMTRLNPGDKQLSPIKMNLLRAIGNSW